jgi:hypothetical protein
MSLCLSKRPCSTAHHLMLHTPLSKCQACAAATTGWS